ncbi:GMC family oxidoreductase N-terminal domain-containing protein [Acidisoma cellulosilytica]|uniref:GMC family oxidoreductase N-terminal domain-containing protein n=1 Tax=Acidisoma cellulosilyticum TaxID=2802395 RepID=A0A963Z1Y6_9PROT|nr:GMC family oxidoreductase N-terminal domain-containing protein [Acidisoma cellulosilyticum]MCB8881362.1 GMC family oxidoreductase N-terminal domain-containing protein [Acidisoma cellulosilyticum]
MTHFLILGGGSAGCALAARLTEDARHRVTLIEAGRDLTAETMPPAIRSRYPGRAYLDPGNIWSSLTAFLGAPGGRTEGRSPRRYEQGRVLGGGSAVNAMVANRGAPGDYDEWGQSGAAGWSWDACLPYFRKLERDVDCDGPFHGKDGPIPVRRIGDAAMSPFVKAVSRTLAAHGHQPKADQNGEWADGIYTGAIAVGDDGQRVPTSIAYLTPDIRRRPNLRIVTDRHVDRITFDGKRATGAVTLAADNGEPETWAAEEVIISTGAIHTAALLLRSGIGPAEALKALGIPVVLAHAGVGANLMEHPSTAVSCYLPPSARLRDLAEHHDHAILRFSSDLAGTPEGDMHAAMIARSGWHSVGQRVGTLFIWVNKAYSRGKVELASRDAHAEPKVDFRLLSDARDMERLKLGFRLGAKTLTDPLMQGWAGTVFPTSYSPRVARIAGAGFVNAAQRGIFGAMLDYAGPLRSALIHGAVTLGTRLDDLLRDDAALTAFIGAGVGGVWHASGTARMGAAEDPMAVTDGQGRVHGAQNLRVVDASLMPTIPRANTNIPTIMMAERIADLIKAERL